MNKQFLEKKNLKKTAHRHIRVNFNMREQQNVMLKL